MIVYCYMAHHQGMAFLSLAYLMLGQTEAVGLALTGTRVESWLPPHAGTSQLARVIEGLERAAPAGESDLARSVQEVADRLERRSLVIVLSADATRDQIERLKGQGAAEYVTKPIDFQSLEAVLREVAQR